MGECYTRWMENELNWVKGIENKIKKDTWRYSLLIPVIFVALLGMIGILTGGVRGMLQNAGIGLIMGIIFMPIFFMMMRASFPLKKHVKSIKKEIEDVLSAEDKEAFAAQMLGMEGNVRCVSWVDEAKREHKVRVSKDFALLTSPGGVVLVQLGRVESIVKDVREYSVTTRSGSFKIEQHTVVYPMYFYYQKPDGSQKRNCDKEFTFGSRETREQVSQFLREVTA